MKGYFENPAETARALRNGWLYTGDLAKCDKDGFFSIVDRKKDIIKTSGYLVFPAEVEEVLCNVPTVAEAAVIGVPDDERGEIVKAILVARDGASVNLSALEAHCLQHLGKQKRPRQFEIVKELPKNFLGKIQRRRLREAEQAKRKHGWCQLACWSIRSISIHAAESLFLQESSNGCRRARAREVRIGWIVPSSKA